MKQRTQKIVTWTAIIVLWGSVIAINVLMTKHGAPQQVWLYCDILGWCRT